jgi:5-methylcytosine-specific restriction endonuclease McrA
MRNLLPVDLPGDSAINRYDGISAAKQLDKRSSLAALRAPVSLRYEDYARRVPGLEALPASPFTSEQGQMLRHCYEVETEPLSKLKVEILEQQPGVWQATCAYCGINFPATVEHYLPKSEFPEYSVCSYNLLPACAECNGIKGSKWCDLSGRKLIHFYYDPIPEGVRWLHARVRMKEGVSSMEFWLEQPAGLDGVFFRLVQQHYDALKLLQRYSRCAVKLLAGATTTASRLGRTAGPVLASGQLPRVFKDMAEERAESHGHNYWEVAAFLGMAESPMFLDTLVSRAPSPERAPTKVA